VLVADCVPVLVAAPGGPVGVAHAGWRGTVGRIAMQLIATLQSAYGVHASALSAAIGPSIGPEDYEVGEEVITAVNAELASDAPYLLSRSDSRVFLDLWEANRRQLVEAGVPAARVEVARVSTARALDRFYSYRAEGQPPVASQPRYGSRRRATTRLLRTHATDRDVGRWRREIHHHCP
jgi:polyphenol oxidase